MQGQKSRYNNTLRKLSYGRIKKTLAINFFYWAFKESLEILMADW